MHAEAWPFCFLFLQRIVTVDTLVTSRVRTQELNGEHVQRIRKPCEEILGTYVDSWHNVFKVKVTNVHTDSCEVHFKIRGNDKHGRLNGTTLKVRGWPSDGTVLQNGEVEFEDNSYWRKPDDEAQAGKSAEATAQPHIIFILADDLGFNGVDYHHAAHNSGSPYNKVRTPYLTELSRTGVVLHSYYSFCWCAPSRFAFLTGRDAWKSEAGFENFRPNIPLGTSTDYKMLPAALKEVGYSTHLVGKWHQGFHTSAYLPTNRGFDTFIGILDSCTNHFSMRVYHGDGVGKCTIDGESPHDFTENSEPNVIQKNDKFSDDRYRNHAIKIIEEHDQSKPLFLYLALQLPHEPYMITSEYASLYNYTEEENIYYGMISHVDDSVKAVVGALEGTGMYSNSILVFSSDNGADAHRTEAPFYGNYPFYGHKGQLWEGGVRVPALIAGGYLPKAVRGTIRDAIFSISDWYATLAHVSGATVDSGGRFPSDSVNHWPLIAGETNTSARTELIYHYSPIVMGTSLHWSTMRRGNWKLVSGIHPCPRRRPCLFNLEKDPREEHDLSSEHEDQVQTMKSMADRSILTAVGMPWFANAELQSDKATQERACLAWAAAGGYLTPWATTSDDMNSNPELLLRFKGDVFTEIATVLNISNPNFSNPVS